MTDQFLPWDRCDWPGLLDAARAGVEEALVEVFERLDGYCRMIAGSRHSAVLSRKLGASDIAQKSLLEAFAQFSEFEGQTEAELRSWLSTIVNHNVIDAARHFVQAERRSQAREVQIELHLESSGFPVTSQPPSLALRKRESDQALARAVAQLPDSQRQVVELRFRDGFDYRSISEQLGISELAARKQCSRAIETLRRQLAAEHGTGI
jgi:RNA polymerase sigma-70 factor (ECF subfamily)